MCKAGSSQGDRDHILGKLFQGSSEFRFIIMSQPPSYWEWIVSRWCLWLCIFSLANLINTYIFKMESNIFIGVSHLQKKNKMKTSKVQSWLKFCWNKHEFYYTVSEGWKLWGMTWTKNMSPNIHNIMYQTFIILYPRTDSPMWFIT